MRKCMQDIQFNKVVKIEILLQVKTQRKIKNRKMEIKIDGFDQNKNNVNYMLQIVYSHK